MEAALKGRPAREFERPDGLAAVEVCALSGQLPEADCPHRVTELFLAGTEPAQTCSLHQRIALDRATGRRATAGTPAERIVERVYTVLPAEAQAWAREQGLPEPPAGAGPEASGARSPTVQASDSAPALALNSPDRGAVYRLDPALPRDAQRIAVAAWAGAPLAQVTLLVDGRPLAQFSVPPYEAHWPLQAGQHVFVAEGVNAAGEAVRSDEVRVEVRE